MSRGEKPVVVGTAPVLRAHQARIAEIRERARSLHGKGATGVQVSAAMCEAVDAFIVDRFQAALEALDPQKRELVEAHCAVIAIGGSGRGEMAPYSDTDLLFLYQAPARAPFNQCTSQMVRELWDAGLQLGHSVRTPAECVSLAKQEPEVATSLVESRLIAGNQQVFDRFVRGFYRKVAGRRLKSFVDDCVSARDEERQADGSSATRLEPDVKRSPGGLRDVHLIRWVGFAQFRTSDIDSLRLKGALAKDDARALLAAQEFLMQIRNDMHFAQGRPQDVLVREEQLRIAEARNYRQTAGQRPVEQFMQKYFRHATAIADIAERFVARHRPKSKLVAATNALMMHRADGIFKVGVGTIDVVPRRRKDVCSNLEQVLRLYRAAALYGVRPVPELVETIQRSTPQFDPVLSSRCIRLVLDILGCSGQLGGVLRSMYKTGVLEHVLPPLTHAHGLLQFNQYHSFTVDEHTLRAVEAAAELEADEGPLGTAYRSIPRKQILHLALLLHDLGKGFDEDHSEVGRRLAEQTSARFNLDNHDRDLLTFLVHKHLQMAHLAFRRDISDPDVLLPFSRDVGSPETLRMLYVLTAADLKAVGPGVWTEWKAELLSDLYDRTMVVVSGKHYGYHEKERLASIKEHVKSSIVPLEGDGTSERLFEWIDRQLDTLPPHYWSNTPPAGIAQDLQQLQQLEPGDIFTAGAYDAETGTVEYRVIAHCDRSDGCFHKLTGALTAKHMEILAAQICTSLKGDVIDRFHVLDTDYSGDVPPDRIEDVSSALRAVLEGKSQVEQLFRRHRRFKTASQDAPVSNLPTRITIDNDSSDRCTVIDVFAHDRPGLLYAISRSIYEMGLSVELAKISTHLDQVVDVFYVTDADGRKLEDRQQLSELKEMLAERLNGFERSDRHEFAS